jgi:hypothetical protein
MRRPTVLGLPPQLVFPGFVIYLQIAKQITNTLSEITSKYFKILALDLR